MAETSAISSHYGKSAYSGSDFSTSFTKPSAKKIALFGGGDSNYLNKVIELNGGIVPVASGAIRH